MILRYQLVIVNLRASIFYIINFIIFYSLKIYTLARRKKPLKYTLAYKFIIVLKTSKHSRNPFSERSLFYANSYEKLNYVDYGKLLFLENFIFLRSKLFIDLLYLDYYLYFQILF